MKLLTGNYCIELITVCSCPRFFGNGARLLLGDDYPTLQRQAVNMIVDQLLSNTPPRALRGTAAGSASMGLNRGNLNLTPLIIPDAKRATSEHPSRTPVELVHDNPLPKRRAARRRTTGTTSTATTTINMKTTQRMVESPPAKQTSRTLSPATVNKVKTTAQAPRASVPPDEKEEKESLGSLVRRIRLLSQHMASGASTPKLSPSSSSDYSSSPSGQLPPANNSYRLDGKTCAYRSTMARTSRLLPPPERKMSGHLRQPVGPPTHSSFGLLTGAALNGRPSRIPAPRAAARARAPSSATVEAPARGTSTSARTLLEERTKLLHTRGTASLNVVRLADKRLAYPPRCEPRAPQMTARTHPHLIY